MDIYAFKTQFENQVQPAPLKALVSAEQAWAYFKASESVCLDEDYCEELGFSVSVASHFDGTSVHYDDNLFQIYFGRLIDAGKGHRWRTAEINFYYHFEMNPVLRSLLVELKQQDIETAYCTSEDEKDIRQKVALVFAFADAQQLIWEAVRGRKPTKSSFSFWIW